jgi:hypothetical protein
MRPARPLTTLGLLVALAIAACAPSDAAPEPLEPTGDRLSAATSSSTAPASTTTAPVTTTPVVTTTIAPPLPPAEAAAELRRRAIAGGPTVIADAPDPYVLRDGDHWYLYATSRRRSLLQVYRSSDLVTWTPLPAPLEAMPSWSTGERQWLWAPAVVRRDDGTYVLFYTAKERTSTAQCIGVATSSSPAGPFVDPSQEPFVCQGALGGSIDPSVFTDGDGTRYLLWKNDGNCCNQPTLLWSAPLGADAASLAAAPVALLRADRAWEGDLVENPAMTWLPDGYHLFYSGNLWDTDRYATGHARCASPLGPCTKTSVGAPAFAGSGDTVAPGGAELVDGHGERWVVYHQWAVGRVGRGSRGVLLAPLDTVSRG